MQLLKRLKQCMKSAIPGLLGVCLLFGGTAKAAELNVVTTTTDLASITQFIGGELVDVTPICAGEDDPHFLEAAPSYITIARRADLWISVGMDLEIGWERPVIDGSRNRRIRPGTEGYLDASQNVIKIEIPEGRVTYAMGDVHPQGNPHYWTDPLQGRIVADTIAGRLAALAPAHRATFSRNLERFKDEIDRRTFGSELVDEVGGERLWVLELEGNLDSYLADNDLEDKLGGWKARMRPFKGAEVVTFHKSWGYFAQRYGLNVPIELEPKPGIPPSPRHLREVVELMNDRDIGAIIMAPFYPERGANLVAQRTGAEVVITDLFVPGRSPEAGSYFEHLDNMVETFASALR